jgi:hypothetical protein
VTEDMSVTARLAPALESLPRSGSVSGVHEGERIDHFNRAKSGIGARDIPAARQHERFQLILGVVERRGAEPVPLRSIQHRVVVTGIANRKDLVIWNTKRPREFCQCVSFARLDIEDLDEPDIAVGRKRELSLIDLLLNPEAD